MKPSLTARRAALATLLTCFFVIFARIGTAQTVPTMTIEIHNDSERYSIYPVLSTKSEFDALNNWPTGEFKITKQPPYPSRPPDGQPKPDANRTMIDCSGNTQFITDTWCQNIFGYTQAAVGQHKREDDYISVPAPAQAPAVPEPTNASVDIGKLDVSSNQITPRDTLVAGSKE